MNNRAFGIIFSNMHDETVQELTLKRTMASIPFGGRYRLIDFALSNMYNSDITKVGVITKSNYQSLMDHLGSGKEWDLSRKREGLFILPPFGSAHAGFYKSRLEALIGIGDFIEHSAGDSIVLTDCDNICNLNYNIPLEYHMKNHADVTVICKRATGEELGGGSLVAYNRGEDGRVSDILIAPRDAQQEYSYGLNMWIVRRGFLESVLEEARAHSLESWERDILQKGCAKARVFAWEHEGYVGRINSLQRYFRINMDLLGAAVRDELFFRHGHIYTKVRDEAPARYGAGAKVANSLVADGCVIEGEVENSVLFRGVSVGRGAKVSNSIVMQSARIDSNVKLNYTIIDKDVMVKDNRILMGFDSYPLYIAKGSVV